MPLDVIFRLRDDPGEDALEVPAAVAGDLLHLLGLRRPAGRASRTIRAVELWRRIDRVIRSGGDWPLIGRSLATNLFWLQVLAHRGKRRRPPVVLYARAKR